MRDTLEEYVRRGNFIRIYPEKGTNLYDYLFEVTRINHKVIYKLLYGEESLLGEKKHTQTPIPCTTSQPTFEISRQSKTRNFGIMNQGKSFRISKDAIKKLKLLKRDNSSENNLKIILTGDDMLIEYVSKLVHTLKSLKESNLKPGWVKAIETFILREDWHNLIDLKTTEKIWQKVEVRLNELKDKHKAKYGNLYKTNQEYETEQQKKHEYLSKFSVFQLEERLKLTFKNSATDLLDSLIPQSCPGVLLCIITWVSTLKRAIISSEHSPILSYRRVKIQESASEEREAVTIGGKTLQDKKIIKIKQRKWKVRLLPLRKTSVHTVDENTDQSGSRSRQGQTPTNLADDVSERRLTPECKKYASASNSESGGSSRNIHRTYKIIGSKASIAQTLLLNFSSQTSRISHRLRSINPEPTHQPRILY